ncbi:carbonyl reductase [Lojkania enalia]|uniref:Carbonyl reductase n=1 Tax=Lojkania enalia TaxID=147567 RepID=A0A9P4N5I3_9PLEO|nr:carbonyl reductase [Didymosphaeria enalia]
MTSKPIVLITGANRGIGYTLAQTLARDHGFHVLLGSRTTESGASAVLQLQSEGLSIQGLPIDLESDISIAAAAKTVQQTHGKLDVLVNNAGVIRDVVRPDSLIRDERGSDIRDSFRETYETNIYGTAAVTAAFIPLLSMSSLPRIVFLSSKLGSISDRLDTNSIYDHVDSIAYRTSKAALNMLAASYARKYADKGWKINAVCPGNVKTGINDFHGKLTTQEAMPNLVRLCMLGPEGVNGTYSDPYGSLEW